jgi:hypothetical protein
VNCEQWRDVMLVYALGTLDPDETRELRAHLASGCVICAAHLAEAEETLAHVPSLRPLVPPPESARSKLLARIQDTQIQRLVSEQHTLNEGRSKSTFRSLVVSAVSGAIAAGLITGIVLYSVLASSRRDAEALVEARTVLEQSKFRNQQLASQLHFANETLSVIQSPRFELFELSGTQRQRAAAGYVLWDKQVAQWHVYLFGLPPRPAAEKYQLWFVEPDGQLTLANSFTVDNGGQVAFLVDVPEGLVPSTAALSAGPPGSSDRIDLFQQSGR